MHEFVDYRQHQVSLSLLMYLHQADDDECNVIHTQIEGNFISLQDAGEPGQSIWKVHFAARTLFDCGHTML